MTHDELNAALNIQRRIDRLQASLDTLRETGGVGCSLGGEAVKGGAGRDAGQVAVEVEQEIAELHEQLKIEREIIRREIAKLEMEDLHRRLLELRYVQCLSWRLVEAAMGYSHRHIMRMHGAASKMAHNGT